MAIGFKSGFNNAGRWWHSAYVQISRQLNNRLLPGNGTQMAYKSRLRSILVFNSLVRTDCTSTNIPKTQQAREGSISRLTALPYAGILLFRQNRMILHPIPDPEPPPQPPRIPGSSTPRSQTPQTPTLTGPFFPRKSFTRLWPTIKIVIRTSSNAISVWYSRAESDFFISCNATLESNDLIRLLSSATSPAHLFHAWLGGTQVSVQYEDTGDDAGEVSIYIYIPSSCCMNVIADEMHQMAVEDHPRRLIYAF